MKVWFESGVVLLRWLGLGVPSLFSCDVVGLV